MQEFEIEDLELESDLQEDDFDQESAAALDKFLNSLNIKNAKDVPAFKTISQKSKKILKRFCSGNNHKNRTHKVIDFYKCLDWLPFEDIDSGFLKKFSDDEQKILLKDIKIYLNKKEEKREQSQNWRNEYKQRIFEYYKKKVPTPIKLELEELRDYELNNVGHDRNWCFYFQFKSFKKIDEFLNLTPKAKEDIFNRFKKDVLSYKMNRERNLFGEQIDKGFCNKHWDDDIVKNINWEFNRKHQRQFTTTFDKNLSEDFAILQLPYGADFGTIKKQYRKLALQYHPDKPNGDEQKMKEIVGAYQRLLNKC